MISQKRQTSFNRRQFNAKPVINFDQPEPFSADISAYNDNSVK